MTDLTLLQAIGSYREQQEAMTMQMKNMVNSLNETMRTELIPQVQGILPVKYGILKPASFIETSTSLGSTHFQARLVALYDEKPIIMDGDVYEEYLKVREDIKPDLDRLAQEKGLASIVYLNVDTYFG